MALLHVPALSPKTTDLEASEHEMKTLAALLSLTPLATSSGGVPVQQATLPQPLVPLELDLGASSWKPICAGSNEVTSGDLEQMALAHAELMRHPTQLIDSAIEGAGLDIVFVASGTLPPGAAAALAACESYIESVFSDPITVTINLSFQPLGAGKIGGTNAHRSFLPYNIARLWIVSDMDANDTIQSFLPVGGIPSGLVVTYYFISAMPYPRGSGPTLTFPCSFNESRLYFTYANWKALGGSIAGADANMVFSTNFTFDYDPSNGVSPSSHSFRDVVVHEVGHALGFCSGGDSYRDDSMILDLFRFQRTDSPLGDENPDTLAEFQTRPRLVVNNEPNDGHISDLISVEYRMADGKPDQMSHFREQTPRIGSMDPRLGPGETYHPDYYTTADLTMFDAIGYDF